MCRSQLAEICLFVHSKCSVSSTFCDSTLPCLTFNHDDDDDDDRDHDPDHDDHDDHDDSMLYLHQRQKEYPPRCSTTPMFHPP